LCIPPYVDLAFPVEQDVDSGRLVPGGDVPDDGITAQGESFVFVSYCGMDEKWAAWVASVLGDAGLTTREQTWDAAPWQDFVKWMNIQLTGARRMIALFSSVYVASYWCSLEWRVALAREMLLPVRVEPVIPPDELLRTLTWVDLFDIDEARARERLLSAIGA
jgi:hypothetical protein